jgi:hypothetical protein
MNGNVQYSVLTRLLALNNKAHDMENQLLLEPVNANGASRIAEMQEEIALVRRTSLATCWLDDGIDEDDSFQP